MPVTQLITFGAKNGIANTLKKAIVGKDPEPPPYVKPPDGNDTAIQAELQREKQLAAKRKGRSSTILTDQVDTEATTGKKTLLGA